MRNQICMPYFLYNFKEDEDMERVLTDVEDQEESKRNLRLSTYAERFVKLQKEEKGGRK